MTSAVTITVHEAASLSSDDRALVVVSTLRANSTIQSSLSGCRGRPLCDGRRLSQVDHYGLCGL